MLRRQIAAFLLILLFLPLLPAQAAFDITLTPGDAVLGYSFSIANDSYAVLEYAGPQEKGTTVLYNEKGVFEGQIALLHSPAGGKFTVTVSSLDQKKLGTAKATVAPQADYTAPSGKTLTRLTGGIALTEIPQGVHYAFSAPDTDYVLLKVHSKEEEYTLPVYPVNGQGLYEGDAAMPLSYARSLIQVSVLNAKGKVLKKAEARKAYQAPEAPAAQSGRLSGVIVCIDPGHQEEKHNFEREPIGPGLSGTAKASTGMAQGRATLRREHIVALEISMMLRDELIRQGATVVLTKDHPMQELSNLERCKVAEDAGAHIMLRIHLDLWENPRKRGFHVYAPLNSDYAKAVADKETYRAMAQMMLDAMKRAAGYPTDGKDKDKYGSVKVSDQFIGNNWAKMTCFLIETAYMSTPREDYMSSHTAYQQVLAEGMAQGVYDIAVYRGWLPADAASE